MNPRRPWERDTPDDIDEQEYDPDRPDPKWDLEDMGEDHGDYAGRRRVPMWVIIIAVLIALALIIQLAWPLVMDLIENDSDSGFPTPGTI